MITKVLKYERFGFEVEEIVHECDINEILNLIDELIKNIDISNSDNFIDIEYNDGTTYRRSYKREDGTLKRTDIKSVFINLEYENYIFGKYECTEIGIVTK